MSKSANKKMQYNLMQFLPVPMGGMCDREVTHFNRHAFQQVSFGCFHGVK